VSTDDADNIDLSWTAPAAGLTYVVHYEDTSVSDPVWKSYGDLTTTAVLTGQPVGHRIAILVKAINAANHLGPATPTQYATPYEPPPPAPEYLTAVSKSGEVDLSWAAVPGALYYVYQKDVTTGGSWTAYTCGTGTAAGPCPDKTNSFAATPLTNGDHYQFYVEATDPGGTSGPSNTVDGNPAAS
jgi:hypothetical protein